MKYRIDKVSGNKISALGFGCMRFANAAKTEELITHAVENGVNYFDTAWIYSGSEEMLGSILSKHNLREKVFIATKLPLVMFKSSSASIDFDKYFNQSLQRLKTGYIDYYLLHMIADTEQWNRLKNWGILDWIARKKKEGSIKQIGFSYHGSKNDFLKIIDDYDWEMVMIQYNYFDENFQAGVTGLRAAAARMPVMIMEPLLGGKLATGLPKSAVKIFKDNDKNLSPAGWALNWLWDQEEVTSLLSGMGNMEQLKENLQLADAASVNMLNDSNKKVYESVLKSIKASYKVQCTGCNYCMPCPLGVNIPGAFTAYNASYSMGFIEGLKQYILTSGFTQVKSASPSLCTKCGKCESLCPQQIPIVKELQTLCKRMEPWFVKLAGRCVRAYFGKTRKKR